MTLSERLAQFACGDVIPSETANRMIALSCLDWAACGLAGVDEPVACLLRAQALGDGGSTAAGLLGGGRVPARAAALVNGATSHALDYDDTHFAHIGHPSVAVFPAAFAVAQDEGIDLARTMHAALIGAEVSIRVGQWLGRDHYQTGFHQTATAGAFGATVASGRLMGLSVDQMTHAIGVASTKAAGLKSQFGTMGKPLNAGLAAECGVTAAGWARAGFVANPNGLDDRLGFGPTHHGASRDDAFVDMGQGWRFETVSHKFHACCHGLHATLEALRDAPSGVTKMVIHTHPRWMSVCNIQRPKTGLEAKFSYPMVAGMALSGIDTGAIQSFSDDLTTRGDLARIMGCITVQPDEGLTEMQARIDVEAPSGTQVLFHDLDAPISMDARHDRLMTKARALIGARAIPLWAAISAADMDGFDQTVFP